MWNYVGNKWPMNFAWNDRLPRSIQESFTCRKSTTWDRRLYFASEGRCAEDFFVLKNSTALAGFEPANLGTSGPPKPPICTHHMVFIMHLRWLTASTITLFANFWPPKILQAFIRPSSHYLQIYLRQTIFCSSTENEFKRTPLCWCYWDPRSLTD